MQYPSVCTTYFCLRVCVHVGVWAWVCVCVCVWASGHWEVFRLKSCSRRGEIKRHFVSTCFVFHAMWSHGLDLNECLCLHSFLMWNKLLSIGRFHSKGLELSFYLRWKSIQNFSASMLLILKFLVVVSLLQAKASFLRDCTQVIMCRTDGRMDGRRTWLIKN